MFDKIICRYSKDRGPCSKCRHCICNSNEFIRLLQYFIRAKVVPRLYCNRTKAVSGDGKCCVGVGSKYFKETLGYLYEEYDGKNCSWRIFRRKFGIKGEK